MSKIPKGTIDSTNNTATTNPKSSFRRSKHGHINYVFIAKFAMAKEKSIPMKRSTEISSVIEENPKKLDDFGSRSPKNDLEKKVLNGKIYAFEFIF